MKKVAIISLEDKTSIEIKKQLEYFFKESIIFNNFSITRGLQFEREYDYYLFTSGWLINNLSEAMKALIFEKKIIAKRILDYRKILPIVDLKENTDVLVTNLEKKSSVEIIEHLNRAEINHINFHEYYPGMEVNKSIKIAITPGEIEVVPKHIYEIIDIGVRKLSVNTVLEIADKCNISDIKRDFILTKFTEELIEITKKYKEKSKRALENLELFETVIQNTDEGIVCLNNEGKIVTANVEAIRVLRCKSVCGKNIKELLGDGFNYNELKKNYIHKFDNNSVMINTIIFKNETANVGIIVKIHELEEILEKEQEIRRKTRKNEHNARYSFDDIKTKDENMHIIIERAKKISNRDSSVLIQGESGTGKEYFAHAIHEYSNRRSGPFVPVNFAAISDGLFESELFGYEEGSFTGAAKGGRKGLFESAHEGTIFLDEIGEMPLYLQTSLLRVLQEKEVRKVGSNKVIPVDIRVIAATNKNLRIEVEKGNFREDLYYRLKVLSINLIPLRDRKADIELLMLHYLNLSNLKKVEKLTDFFTQEAVNVLYQYRWPGNIRELVNATEYFSTIKELDKIITLNDLNQEFFELQDSVEKPEFQDGLKINSQSKESLSHYFFELEDVMSVNKKYETVYLGWLLVKIYENNGIGRRKLSVLASMEGLELSEGKIRSLLLVLKDHELIKTMKGSFGNVITEKGLRTIRRSITG